MKNLNKHMRTFIKGVLAALFAPPVLVVLLTWLFLGWILEDQDYAASLCKGLLSNYVNWVSFGIIKERL